MTWPGANFGAVFLRSAISSDPRSPIHPPLVHAPIGGVVIAAACDVVSGVGGASHGWAQTWFRGGSYALIVATAVLVMAVVAGFVDRARRTARGSGERAAVNRHAVVMSLMGAACVTDVVLRTTHYESARHTPVLVLALGLVAVALATLGGELGGRLVYRHGIGIDAPAPPKPRPGDAPPIAAPAARRSA
jgi:uncharacterized membrane protein